MKQMYFYENCKQKSFIQFENQQKQDFRKEDVKQENRDGLEYAAK